MSATLEIRPSAPHVFTVLEVTRGSRTAHTRARQDVMSDVDHIEHVQITLARSASGQKCACSVRRCALDKARLTPMLQEQKIIATSVHGTSMK